MFKHGPATVTHSGRGRSSNREVSDHNDGRLQRQTSRLRDSRLWVSGRPLQHAEPSGKHDLEGAYVAHHVRLALLHRGLERQTFMAKLFAQAGFTPKQSETRAKLLIGYLSVRGSMFLDESANETKRTLDRMCDLLTTP